MNYTLGFIAAHLIGAFAYHQTGDGTFLYINIATMGYALFQFIKVGVLVLSPNWEVELSYAEHIPWNWKLLHNSVQALSLIVLYIDGWVFLSGFGALYLLITTISILITILNVDFADIEGDDE